VLRVFEGVLGCVCGCVMCALCVSRGVICVLFLFLFISVPMFDVSVVSVICCNFISFVSWIFDFMICQIIA